MISHREFGSRGGDAAETRERTKSHSDDGGGGKEYYTRQDQTSFLFSCLGEPLSDLGWPLRVSVKISDLPCRKNLCQRGEGNWRLMDAQTPGITFRSAVCQANIIDFKSATTNLTNNAYYGQETRTEGNIRSSISEVAESSAGSNL